MSFHPQAAIGADSAIGIHRQTGRCQPGRAQASGAKQAGSAVWRVVLDQCDPSPLQHLLDAWIQLSAALLQLQLPLRPAASQRQHHFQARSSRSDHPQWPGIAWVFALEKGERCFQGLDGDPCGARSAHGPHIQAEPIEVEFRPPLKLETVLLRLQSNDFCFHEGHPRPVTELTQVDGELVALINASDQSRHHAGIQSCAASVHQGDALLGASLRLHAPAFEQKCMAVAAAGQKQPTSCSHGLCRYPAGLACCQAQPSRHMSSRLR